MATHLPKSYWLPLALLSLAVVSGCCCQAVPLPDEACCPTDARRLYFTCGEEAVRHCPCGPGSEFYGLKPTCWREWPEGWQCNGCAGMPYVDRAQSGDAVCLAPPNARHRVEASASEQFDLSNPFRSKSGAAEMPLRHEGPEFAPTKSATVNTTSAPASRSQPTPTVPPALEKVPSQTAPTTSTPALKKNEFENPFVKQASAETALPPILTLDPPANAPAGQTAAFRTVAATEPSPQQPKPLPLIEDAKPILAKERVAKWQPPKYIPNTIVAAALIKVEKRLDNAPSPSPRLDKDPSMSNRVEQHLLNNLQL